MFSIENGSKPLPITKQTTSNSTCKIPSVNTKEITIGEPVLLNPNSYENLEKIIDSLKETLDIGSTRQWSFIGCDGPPCCLSSRLIERNPKKYDWVSMVSGLGHLNMNQVKTFFKIADQIFLESLGKEVLHFESLPIFY